MDFKIKNMRKNIFCVHVLFFLVHFSYSQKKKSDTIKTEVINVVKEFEPVVLDAFKIKDSPITNSDIDLKKKKVTYDVFSIPVASTFTPSKGKVANLDKSDPVKLYNNYASLAVGNYLNILAELYVTLPLNIKDNLIIGLNHHSAQGEIQEVQLDDKFYDTDFNLTYLKRDKQFSYQITGLYKNQQYNWYGTSYKLTDLQRSNIDASHTYFTGGISSYFEIENSFFKEGILDYSRFWDTYESSENNLRIVPKFSLNILDFDFDLCATIDYVGGKFGVEKPELEYSYLKTAINPSYKFEQDNLILNIGAEFVLGSDAQNSNTDFYVYPKVNASYNLFDNKLIVFAGVNGGLEQNSYKSFSEKNKFLAPTLFISPTHKQYDAFLGFKGNFTDFLSYEFNGGFSNEENKPFFKMNPVNDVDLQIENYLKVNSFGVVYDNLNTFKFEGNIKAKVFENYEIGLRAFYYNFETDKQEFAWNMPEIKLDLFANFIIGKEWYGGMNLFYTGERYDMLLSSTNLVTERLVKLDAFFDINLNLGYNITNRFSVFIKANNIANQGYQRWQTYPVQQAQFLGGFNYKFDF